MADTVNLKKSYCDDQDNNFETKSMTSSHTQDRDIKTVSGLSRGKTLQSQDLASLKNHDSSHESSRLCTDVQRYIHGHFGVSFHLFVRRCLLPFGRPFDHLLLLPLRKFSTYVLPHACATTTITTITTTTTATATTATTTTTTTTTTLAVGLHRATS